MPRQADPSPIREEVGLLAAALCERGLTPEESRRLDELTRDPEALTFLARYLLLVGELQWSGTGGCKPAIAEERQECGKLFCGKSLEEGHGAPLPVRSRRAIYAIAACAAGIVLVVTAAAWWILSNRLPPSPGKSAARLLGTFSRTTAPFTDTDSAPDWYIGETKQIEVGVAAWGLPNGNTWTLEGPATATLVSADRVRLDRGRAVFQVHSPGIGFRVDTPFGSVVDRGTAFALDVNATGAEIHVLSGQVEVQWEAEKSPIANHGKLSAASRQVSPRDRVQGVHVLHAGQAVRFDSRRLWHSIAFAPARFIQDLPQRGSSSALRYAALRSKTVLSVFSFETSPDQWFELISGERLRQTVLKGGGDLKTLATEPGWGPGAKAVRIARGPGNSFGAALQTAVEFSPPRSLSLEAVFRFDGFSSEDGSHAVGTVLATRHDRDQATFFLAVSADGTLMHLFHADEPWLVTAGRLEPGHWYYVASTFAAGDGSVLADTWLADLTRGETRLQRVLRTAQVSGSLAVGPLGIGKGIDAAGAHAYAFPGAIDEIVLYNGIVDEGTFSRHLDLLAGEKSGMPRLPAPPSTMP